MATRTTGTGTEAITYNPAPTGVWDPEWSQATVTHSSVVDGHRRRIPISHSSHRRLKAIGIGLIVVSLLMVAYAAYQIWGTGVLTERHQQRLAVEFETRLDAAAQGVLPAPSTDSTAPTIAEPLSPWDNPVIEVTVPEPTLDPAGDALTTTTEAAAGVLLEIAPASGQVLGRISAEAIDLDWMVVEGVTAGDLEQGPGHMPHTPIPGQPGNAVISGHRTTNGAPFHHLDRLQPGDRITVDTLIGSHIYEVVGSRIVEPTGVWVTEQWEGAWLTLTTCNPLYSSRERLIVFAKLVEGPNEGAVEELFAPTYALPEPPTG